MANVFKSFGDMNITLYGLDPGDNYNTPALAWQAALKMTGFELNLFTDMDMHLLLKRKTVKMPVSSITGSQKQIFQI